MAHMVWDRLSWEMLKLGWDRRWKAFLEASAQSGEQLTELLQGS